MSAPATKLAVPCPVKTTAATSARRDRCSTTTVNSSSARSFSALTGGLVTVTVATRRFATGPAASLYCTVK